MNKIHCSEWFYGNKISDYGLEQGYLDYRTLAKSFNHILNNEIIGATDCRVGCWEPITDITDDDGNCVEIFQYFIVEPQGATIIEEYTDDPLFYNEELDMYVWGVTHYGTSWDYVLTDVKIKLNGEEK